MSQHVLDLRRSMQNVRRHSTIAVSAIVLGLATGAAFTMLNPPMLESRVLVELPLQPPPHIKTQVVVAGSDPVLAPAIPHVHPALSLGTLHDRVRVTSLTPDILEIAAQGATVAEATSIANAVAASYISYIHSPTIPDAWVLEPATSATGTPLYLRLLGNAGLGALFGILVGTVVALAVGRNDGQLWRRDEIADATGIPVLASISVGHPRDAVGWRRLVESYDPGAADSWRLRSILRQLGVASDNGCAGTSVSVVSLSCDPGALALGPHLAAFAASLGITTALVIGAEEDSKGMATLRAACAAASDSSSARPIDLLIGDKQGVGWQPGHALSVFVVVIDGHTPRPDETIRTNSTVLGVSAGATTAEQLARVAVSIASQGRHITGIIVGDPDAADDTTGRFPQPTRHAIQTRPTRLPGIPLRARQ
jgi:hypothetical protein